MPSARTLLALAVAAPWVAWAVVRLLGLDTGHPAVAAMSFTPYVAAAAWVPVIAALLLRRRGVALLALAAAVGLVAAVLPRAVGDGHRPAGATGPALRVLTTNVYAGRGDAATVMDLVRELDVDLLSVQELTPEAVEQLDDAGAAERFPHRLLRPVAGVAAGTGLWSRHPLGDPAPDDATEAEQPEAELRVPGAAPARVKAVHPRPPISRSSEPEWQASLDRMPRPRGRGPLRLLIGDFNATLDHRALRGLLGDGYVDAAEATGDGLAWTWPSGRRRPRITIDHVLLDRRLGVREVSVHGVPGTDHRAVFAELRLPPA